MFSKKENGANVLSKDAIFEVLISKIERRDWILRKEQFVSKSMCKSSV
jgi:hypothetical protein